MPNFVLDCSVALGMCLQDENNSYDTAVLEAMDSDMALAPKLLMYEFTNGLKSALLRNRISMSHAVAVLSQIQELAIRFDDTDQGNFNEIFDLSVMYDLSVYDATYLHLSLKHRLPLATTDDKLSKAALKAGIKIYLK